MNRRRGTKRTHHGFCKTCGTKLYRGQCASCDQLFPARPEVSSREREPRADEAPRRATVRPSGTPRRGTPATVPEALRAEYEARVRGQQPPAHGQAEAPVLTGCLGSLIRIGCGVVVVVFMFFIAISFIGACLDFAEGATYERDPQSVEEGGPSERARANLEESPSALTRPSALMKEIGDGRGD